MTVAENEPLAFKFNATDQTIRVEMVENQPYFVAKDICEALGLTNPSVTIQQLDDDERTKRNLGRQGEAWCVNESGLYNLIFRSNKPEAKAFRKWVTSEVLPAIRQTGSYQPEQQKQLPQVNRGGRLADIMEFVDLRDIMYDAVELNGHKVRHIIHEDCDWYSMNDIVRAVAAATGSSQIAKKLNAKKTLAAKFWVFGNTHPSWFCKSSGLGLILSGSRILKNKELKLIIPNPQMPELSGERKAV